MKNSFESVFNQIVAHESELKAYVSHRLPVNIDVDDVIQEVYLRILRNYSKISIRSPKAYFFRSARNLLYDKYRIKENSPIIDVDSILIENLERPDSLNTISYLEGYELYQLLNDAVEQLPPRCKYIFKLYYHEKLSYRDISKLLNLSHATIQKQLYIGLKRCRSYCNPKGVDKKRQAELLSA